MRADKIAVPVIRRFRSWIKAHRVGGPGWWLLVPWVGLGAAGAGYAFVLSTQRMTELCDLGAAPSWVGEPSVIVTAATIGSWAWVLLAMPVLAAGLVQLRAWRAASMPLAGAWAGAWAAGLALMFLAAGWLPDPPVCGSSTGYYTASVAWVDLPACIAFLALGAVMTRILARSLQRPNYKIASLAGPRGVPGEQSAARRRPGLVASMYATIALVMARSTPWASCW